MENTLGNWITLGTGQPFCARRSFQVKGDVQMARAKVCSPGQFLLQINGESAGDHEPDPGWSSCRNLIRCVTFDVTSRLRQGENVLGAEVGNGCFFRADELCSFSLPDCTPFEKNPVLALTLEIRFTDGRRETVQGDESFRVAAHPAVMSSVNGSETMDGRLARQGWCSPGYDDSGWKGAVLVKEEDAPKGKLTEQIPPAVKVVETRDAQLLGEVIRKDGETSVTRTVYDLGRNMSAILELEMRGRPGDRIQIYPAENLLPDGDVEKTDTCITCISGRDREWETFRMKFTYMTGRYIALEKSGEDIRVRNIKAQALTGEWEDGCFTCDNEELNRIYAGIKQDAEADLHTGCPCRILETWRHWLLSGDLQIVRDNYEAGKRYFDSLETNMPPENVKTAFFYAEAVTLERFAALLGKEADEKKYARCAQEIRENYNEKLLVRHPEQGFWCYRAFEHPDEIFPAPADQALPLCWGLTPKDKEQDVAKALRFSLERDGALCSSDAALPFIIQCGRKYGMNDLIARFVLTLDESREKNPHQRVLTGFIIEWFYNGIAGILPEEPGFKKITVRPFLPENVGEFSCSYHSASGLIQVHVKDREGKIHLDVETAKDIDCTIDTGGLADRGEVIAENTRDGMPTYEEWNRRREGERMEELKQYQKRSSPALMIIAGFCLALTGFQNFRAARAVGLQTVPGGYLAVMALEMIAGFCLLLAGFRSRRKRREEEWEEARVLQEAREKEQRLAREKIRQERLIREEATGRDDQEDACTQAPGNPAPGSLTERASLVARLRERERTESE